VIKITYDYDQVFPVNYIMSSVKGNRN